MKNIKVDPENGVHSVDTWMEQERKRTQLLKDIEEGKSNELFLNDDKWYSENIKSVVPIYKDLVPMKSGTVKIKQMFVSSDRARWDNLYSMMNHNSSIQNIDPGHYIVLEIDLETMMSDTPMERITNRDFIKNATGDVLIGGLGLGMCIQALLNKPDVTSITIIELNNDVIKLVAPLFKNDKVKIIHNDIFTWVPDNGQKFDTIYFDIWYTADSENIKSEMNPLIRRYRKYLKDKTINWISAWRLEELRAQRRREQRSNNFWY